MPGFESFIDQDLFFGMAGATGNAWGEMDSGHGSYLKVIGLSSILGIQVGFTAYSALDVLDTFGVGGGGAGGLGAAEQDLVLATNKGDVLLQEGQKVILENLGSGRRLPQIGTSANVLKDPAGFASQIPGAGRIIFNIRNMAENTPVTLGEMEYILQHPELWARVFIRE